MSLFVTLFHTRPEHSLSADVVLDQIRTDWGEQLAEEFASVTAVAGDQVGSAAAIEVSFDAVDVLVLENGLPADSGIDLAAAAAAGGHWGDDLAVPDLDGPSVTLMAVTGDGVGDDERDPMGEAILLSRTAASLQSLLGADASAVLTHPAEILVPAADFRAGAIDAAPGLPLSMWVDFIVADSGGVTEGETLGMLDLALYDVEITESRLPAAEIVKALVDTAVAQYRDGLVLDDGMVLESASGDFSVSVAPSKYDAETYVIRLDPPVLANRAQRRAAERRRRRFT